MITASSAWENGRGCLKGDRPEGQAVHQLIELASEICSSGSPPIRLSTSQSHKQYSSTYCNK
uniref:Uncharacterized protein n=1 Tax=Romanomermis culicivorax TaxID=13658 RepID=A0A915HHB2_ROMCU